MRTAYELVELFKKAYRGPRAHFLMARLKLQTGIDLDAIRPFDHDPVRAERLREALLAICPDLDLEQS